MKRNGRGDVFNLRVKKREILRLVILLYINNRLEN